MGTAYKTLSLSLIRFSLSTLSLALTKISLSTFSPTLNEISPKSPSPSTLSLIEISLTINTLSLSPKSHSLSTLCLTEIPLRNPEVSAVCRTLEASKPSPSAVASSEALVAVRHRCPSSCSSSLSKLIHRCASPLFVIGLRCYSATRCVTLVCSGLNARIGYELLAFESSVREVAELYGSEKSFVVEVQRALSGLHYTALIALERKMFIKSRAKLRRRCQELTQTTPDPPVDDEAAYYKAAGECPKGRVYGLGSLGRKKRRYVVANASTSQVLAQRGIGNFMIPSGMQQWKHISVADYISDDNFRDGIDFDSGPLQN
ncbi:hypothetical protein Syun_014635 [Stephania yunnanensis]|uniref:Uncharacterized protein n=1 Tax=Stephania yunnanensis TaxID=152371 RepID=A0AAP0JKK3_9MAGN